MKKTILLTYILLGCYCVVYGQVSQEDFALRKRGGITLYPLKEKKPNIALTMYPNPASDHVLISSNKALNGFNLEVIDQAGNSAIPKQLWLDQKLDVSKLRAGIYIVRFSKGRENYAKKLIVKRE